MHLQLAAVRPCGRLPLRVLSDLYRNTVEFSGLPILSSTGALRPNTFIETHNVSHTTKALRLL